MAWLLISAMKMMLLDSLGGRHCRQAPTLLQGLTRQGQEHGLLRQGFENLSRGAPVSRGAALGFTGQTGVNTDGTEYDTIGHLHFEVLRCDVRSGYSAAANVDFFDNDDDNVPIRQLGGQGNATHTRRVNGTNYTFTRVDPLNFLPLNNLAPASTRR